MSFICANLVLEQKATWVARYEHWKQLLRLFIAVQNDPHQLHIEDQLSCCISDLLEQYRIFARNEHDIYRRSLTSSVGVNNRSLHHHFLPMQMMYLFLDSEESLASYTSLLRNWTEI